MLEYIDAPMPFIIGVPKHLWKTLKQREPFPNDIVVFDIDKNKLRCGEELPELPGKAAESVYAVLLSVMDEREKARRSCRRSAECERKVSAG